MCARQLLLLLLLLSSSLFIFFSSQILYALLLDISGRDRTDALPAFCTSISHQFFIKESLDDKRKMCDNAMERVRVHTLDRIMETANGKSDYQISCIWNVVPKTSTAALTLLQRHMLSLLKSYAFIHEMTTTTQKTGRAFVCSRHSIPCVVE